jgi:hypothetical protein
MHQPRKIEYFEDQLKVTPQGKVVLQVIRTHAKEVMYLVQKNRPTMVCWQRHHGPIFIKSVVDSGFEEDTIFIKEVKGVTIETLLLHMAEVLQDNGTAELKGIIGQHVFNVLHIMKNSNSLKSIINHINYSPMTA